MPRLVIPDSFRRWIASAARGLLALHVAAMLSDVPAKAQANTANIAIAVSSTGPGATFGLPAIEGAQLAIEEANARVGALRIGFTVHDDMSNDARAQDVARQIIASDALAVVGPATTPMALASGPIYAQAGLVAIGTTATGDNVTDNGTFFRASFSTGDAGELLANYLNHVLGGTRAVVIFKDDGYGRPVAAGFRRGAERLGIATVYRPFTTPAEAEEAARLAAQDPGKPAIILAMISDFVPVMTTLRRRGADGPILGTNAIAGDYFSSFFADQSEERLSPGFFADGVYAASPLLFDSANAETLAFAERYRARFGHDPSYISVQGYEAASLAVAAVRAAVDRSDVGTDLKARRQAVLSYLASLDGPGRAVAGLNGPLWFTPDRGRLQALRIGRFHGTRLESAPTQLVPVSHPDRERFASGAIVDMGSGRFAARQAVVYTGFYLNEIARLDLQQSTFTADFYLWMRFARGQDAADADPADIQFPGLVRGNFAPAEPAVKWDLEDGTTYRLWQVRGEFKNDFDLHQYPADHQTLAIRLFNARAASNQLVYVLDKRSLDVAASTPLLARVSSQASALSTSDAATAVSGTAESTTGWGFAPEAFRNLTQWDALRAVQRRDNLVTQSALGDLRLVGLEQVRELSGFSLIVELRRRVAATLVKTLLPLGLMTLIMFASLFFPTALVKEKVTVAITAALSGAVLLSSINSQLGSVGYVIAIEYVFYVFFVLCLLCILAVLEAERFRARGRQQTAIAIEKSGRALFLLGVVGTVAAAVWVYAQW